MKRVRGETFAAALRRRPGPAVDLAAALTTFRRVCDAVGYAHGKRIVHRDLKPDNVMIGAHGEVVLVDWGLAKKLGPPGQPPPDDVPKSRAVLVDTRAGELETQAGLGSVPYLSPEQATGRAAEMDERTDVFGLGAVLCVVLTGLPPYVGPTARVVERRALRGDLEETYERLDGCGADPELVAICKNSGMSSRGAVRLGPSRVRRVESEYERTACRISASGISAHFGLPVLGSGSVMRARTSLT